MVCGQLDQPWWIHFFNNIIKCDFIWGFQIFKNKVNILQILGVGGRGVYRYSGIKRIGVEVLGNGMGFKQKNLVPKSSEIKGIL